MSKFPAGSRLSWAVLAAVCAGLAPLAARAVAAGWEGIPWGTPRAEAIAMARGFKAVEPKPYNSRIFPLLQTAAEGERTVALDGEPNGLTTDVGLLFSEDRLDAVAFSTVTTPQACDAWERELRARYGAPRWERRVADDPERDGDNSGLNLGWDDPANGNRLLYSEFGQSLCSVIVGPLSGGRQPLGPLVCAGTTFANRCTYSGP